MKHGCLDITWTLDRLIFFCSEIMGILDAKFMFLRGVLEILDINFCFAVGSWGSWIPFLFCRVFVVCVYSPDLYWNMSELYKSCKAVQYLNAYWHL